MFTQTTPQLPIIEAAELALDILSVAKTYHQTGMVSGAAIKIDQARVVLRNAIHHAEIDQCEPQASTRSEATQARVVLRNAISHADKGEAS